MLKKIALAVLALIALLLIYAATRPDTFRVERTARIAAPAEKIYPLIDDFHRWSAWSPYEKLEPDMKRTFGGAPAGKGATYDWEGKDKAGAGRMEITESTPSSKVAIKLDFIKPFEGHNTAEFTLQPQGDATQVTWAMYGPSPYVAKLMGIFFNMDTMIGKDFEVGLANLKTATEK
ncbi:polyketide cyclase [Variovorax sp. KBW07]|uniref:SRPBCC family protein n=1 Tax=Variovorax sp. KBW07 TaxID=2153358 RepID=UPI000F576FC5|nr:SRPBCC family protein [Variovorax sp. KBW07]RQO46162.1 polyketide cyclase [Variovorax sp. KBW07]